MISESKIVWLQKGYTIFAQEGPKGLKVEVLARLVNKNKSSFYHHFADLEIFTEILLQYHLERAAIMAEAERRCRNVDPELLQVIIQFKEDLFFNRQLRVHRAVAVFKQCMEQSNAQVAGAIIDIWAEALGLSKQTQLAALVLNLSFENFFLQITEENMNYTWLSNYVKELKTMVKAFKNMPC